MNVHGLSGIAKKIQKFLGLQKKGKILLINDWTFSKYENNQDFLVLNKKKFGKVFFYRALINMKTSNILKK